MVDITAWVNFLKTNSLIEMIFCVNAVDCRIVDTPPKDIIKQHSIVDVWYVNPHEEISKHPFVISHSPEKNEIIIFLLIPMPAIPSTIELNRKLVVIISITTNEKHITPPIKRIEDIDSATLSLNDVFLWCVLISFCCKSYCLPRYIIPLIIAPKMWQRRMVYPIFALENIPIPTEPKINIGPEFEQKLIAFFAFCFEIWPFL